MVSGHAILAKPVLLPLSAASASCRPISRFQQGILGVRGERAWWVDKIALQKPVSHSVICSQCLLLAYWPVSAMGAISTGSTWRSLEIKLCYGEWTCYPCKTCTPPFICSQRFLSAYIPVPARDTWSTWRKSLVSWHDSLAEICFSSHYLQLVPPVGLLTGFSKGCNFYLEDVEKEPGDYIVLWWVDMIALQKPVSHPVICSQCLLLAHLPVSAMGAISTGSTWRRSLEINCAVVSGHDSLAETCF